MSNIAEKELELMKHLINFGGSGTNSTVNNKPVLEYHKKGADGKTYGIVRECNKFYIKVAPDKDTEVLAEDYNYIGGINNRKEYEYPTYTIASKHFDLKMRSLNEAYPAKTVVTENKVETTSSEWQIQETKEMRAEIERFKQISNNVDMILSEENRNGFTTAHTLPEAPAKNPSDKEVNSPFTDTAVAKLDKDFKKELKDPEKAGKPFEKDGEVTDADMESDKNERGEKGEVYTEKAKFVPSDSVANKKPAGAKTVKMNEAKRVFKVTEEQVLAWNDAMDYMDKSNGTEIGSSAPYGEKCTCPDGNCPVHNNKAVNEGFYGQEQTPADVAKVMNGITDNAIGLDNGDIVYIDYDEEENKFIAGGATNAGIIPEYEMEYDLDRSFDENLQDFIAEIEVQSGSNMTESKKFGLKESTWSPETPEEVVEYMKGMRSNMFELGDSVFYVNYDPQNNMLQAGDATNIGFKPMYEVEYDFAFSFDANLQNLYDTVEAEMTAEGNLGESCDVFHNSDCQDCPTPGNGEIGDPQPFDIEVNEENVDVNDVAGMPDEMSDDIPFPEVEGEFDFGDDDEWGFEDDEEEPVYGESINKGNTVNEEMVLHDFGKHPAYRKTPMTTPPNKEVSKVGKEWDDKSAQGEEPFGKSIGKSSPYDELVNLITDAVIESLSKKKS